MSDKTMFQADDTQDSGFAARLQNPFIGKAKLVDFAKEEINDVANCFKLTFRLEGENIKGEDVTGLQYEYVEWAPTDDEEWEKTKNKLNRIGYIVRHFLPEDQLGVEKSLQAGSWEEFVNGQLALLDKHNATEREDITIKIMGDTYSTPKVKCPGYQSFMANKLSDQPLVWSDKEREENQAFLKARAMQPDENEAIEQNGQPANGQTPDELEEANNF